VQRSELECKKTLQSFAPRRAAERMAQPTVQETLARAKALFSAHFHTAPTLAASAPGRVNLIGEHTDYNDGFVMPLALSGRTTVVVGHKTESGVIRVATESNIGGVNLVEVQATKPGVAGSKEPKWANYVKGAILQFYANHGNRDTFDSFDIAIASDVPLGSGLSSSASLEVAVFTFLEGLTGHTVDKKEKALLAQKGENEFVGVPCGCMDQFISVLGKAGHALLLDCRSRDTKYVPMTDESIVLLVANSNVKHELTGGEYAQRRAQCYAGVDALKKAYPTQSITALRDVTQEQLNKIEKDLDPIVFRRSRHVIGENDRTTHAAAAFAKGEYELCGKLMVQSHNSLRDDYEVSCHELDLLVTFALEVDGVYGSRMTGGGFGGCTITLLKKSALEKAIEHISSKYVAATKITPTIFATVPGDGASVSTL
jgi:galactokinase